MVYKIIILVAILLCVVSFCLRFYKKYRANKRQCLINPTCRNFPKRIYLFRREAFFFWYNNAVYSITVYKDGKLQLGSSLFQTELSFYHFCDKRKGEFRLLTTMDDFRGFKYLIAKLVRELEALNKKEEEKTKRKKHKKRTKHGR